MANPFIHIELQTSDTHKAKKFYGSLFGWQIEAIPGMDYMIIDVGEGTGGGMLKNPVEGALDTWIPYVLVDDIAASTEKAKSLGAKVCKDVTEVPGYGWLSVIQDLTGATFGLWQPKSMK